MPGLPAPAYNVTLATKARFKTLRDANFDLMKLCEEHDTSYERGRLDMQQYRFVRARIAGREVFGGGVAGATNTGICDGAHVSTTWY